MKKIRINELARELEVKAHEILERLPELGVSEKKTHSSSIDEDVAIKLRQYYGQDIPDYVHDPNADDSASEGHEEHGEEGHETPPAISAVAVAPVAPAPALPPAAESAPVPKEEKPAAEETPRPMAPIRPPLAGRPIHPPVGAHASAKPAAPRAAPAPPAPPGPHRAPPPTAPPVAATPHVPAAQPATPAPQTPPAAVFAPGVKAAQQLDHFLSPGRVESAGRLVGQQQRGLVGERPGDGQTLTLAARQHAGHRRDLVADAEQVEQVARPRFGRFALASRDNGRQGHVLQYGHPLEQVEELEDDADVAPPHARELVLGTPGHLLAGDLDGPLVGPVEANHQVQQRRLATTRGPHQGEERALLDSEVDAPERPHRGVLGLKCLAHTVHFESGRVLVRVGRAVNGCRIGHADPPSMHGPAGGWAMVVTASPPDDDWPGDRTL